MSDLPGLHTVDYATALFINSVLLLMTIYWCFKLFFPSIFPSTGSQPAASPATTIIDVPSSPSPSPDGEEDDTSNVEIEMYRQTQTQIQPVDIKEKNHIKELPLTTKILSCSILILITILLWVECILDLNGRNKTECIVLSFNMTLDWIARSMLYIYYMYRSRNVFIGTALEMRKCVFNIMVTWFIFGYSLCAFSTFLWAFYYGCPPVTSDTVRILASWLLLNETFSQMFCLCYFIFKMRKLIKESSIPEMAQNEAVIQAQKKMKYITKKLLILALFYNIMAGVNVLLAGRGLYFARPFEHFIVCICMILSFGFMDKHYRKICCLCIYCCKNCCN